MESRITKVRVFLSILPLALFLSGGIGVNAQSSPNRVFVSFSDYYSPKTNSNTSEIGIGYLFNKAGLSLKYGRIGLSENEYGHEEAISIFVPNFNVHSFSMIPEVAAGIIHSGKSSDGSITVKGQIQISLAIRYNLSNSMSCGIIYKTIHYRDGTIPLLGWNYSLAF